jgi:predicted transglutaminase-like cysteine proteinase
MSSGARDFLWRSAAAGIIFLALLGCSTASMAHNRPPSMTHPALSMTVGESVRPPGGWVEFCHTYKGVCDTMASVPREVVLSKKAWSDLNRINLWVNDHITPMTDMAHYGKIQWWRYPDDGAGACHSFALLKRRLLMQAGWPREALLMTVVFDQEGNGHAILTVKTDKGDFILDNLRSDIRLWSRTGYQFLMRQSQSDPNQWAAIVEGPAGVAIAALRARQSMASLEPARSLVGEQQAQAQVSVPPLPLDWREWTQNSGLVLADTLETRTGQVATPPKLIARLDRQTDEGLTADSNSATLQRNWSVQLIGDSSESSALDSYYKLRKTYDTLLRSREPVVNRSRVGTNASWYRVRVAADNRDDAERLCNSLRAAGGSCIVQRD